MQDPNYTHISISEVLPRLYVGNQAAARLIPGFDMIVNCTAHIPNYWLNTEYIRIPVNDPHYADFNENDKMVKFLLFYLPRIRARYQAGARILIHCHAGIQRSATVALMLLYILSRDLSYNKLYDKSYMGERIVPRNLYGSGSPSLRDIVRYLVDRRKLVFYGGTQMNFYPAIVRMINILQQRWENNIDPRT